MTGLTLMTLFLIGMVVECAREAYGTSWAARHYTRIMKYTHAQRPPRDFWTERKSRSERRLHRRKSHIDLLERSRIKQLQDTKKDPK